MVERVNLTIKTATIHETSYDSYDCLEKHLMEFLVFYNTNRRHESLVKELKVKTPLDACNKWINTVPHLFVKKHFAVWRFNCTLCITIVALSNNNVMNFNTFFCFLYLNQW